VVVVKSAPTITLIISMMLFEDQMQQADAREQLEKQSGLKSRGVVVSFQFFTLVGVAKPTESSFCCTKEAQVSNCRTIGRSKDSNFRAMVGFVNGSFRSSASSITRKDCNKTIQV